VLEESLALLHPLLPFVTEEIYQKLPGRSAEGASGGAAMLMSRAYPEGEAGRRRRGPRRAASRRCASSFASPAPCAPSSASPPETKVRLALRFEEGFERRRPSSRNGALVGLTRGRDERPRRSSSRPEGTVALVGRGFEAYAFVKESVDRREASREAAQGRGEGRAVRRAARAKLANEGFTGSAPAEVVAKEREKLEEAERRAGKYRQYLEELS
jgi:valyl-tRNA synthetase